MEEKVIEIQIVTGFLGAGKTTFLNRYLPVLDGKTAVIENEFGEVGLDGEFLPENLPVKEISAGCICCSLAVDFRMAIPELVEKYQVDRIVIEPSGISRLTDVIQICEQLRMPEGTRAQITKLITMVDLTEYEDLKEEFGEFYYDQMRKASLILPGNMEGLTKEKKAELLWHLKNKNRNAIVYEEDWRVLSPESLLELVEVSSDYVSKLTLTRSTDKELPQLTAFAIEEPRVMTKEELLSILKKVAENQYGHIYRGKGILESETGEKYRFDFTKSKHNIEESKTYQPKQTKVILIGNNLKKEELINIFKKE